MIAIRALVLGALAGRCRRADLRRRGDAADRRPGHRHDGHDLAAARGRAFRAGRPADAAAARRTPDVLISEDARLVALPIGDGELAVNRDAAERIHHRQLETGAAGRNHRRAEEPSRRRRHGGSTCDPLDLPPGRAFLLATGDLCLARHPSGAIVALCRKTARRAAAGLCVFGEPDRHRRRHRLQISCRDPLVLGRHQARLAPRGSAAVFFDPQSARPVSANA